MRYFRQSRGPRPAGRARRFIALLSALALLSTAAPALASGDEQVTIVLKNGAKYRGNLVEEVPDDHVTIQLATGEIKTFAWSDIVRDAGGAAPEPLPARTTPKPAEGTSELAPKPSGPRVHIEAKQAGLVLERKIGHSEITGGGLSADHFEHVCRAPCDVTVAAGEYRLRGDGLRSSTVFELRGQEPVRIDAKLGSSTGHLAGNVLLGGGIGAAVMGLALFAMISPRESCSFDAYGAQSCQRDTSTQDLGLVFVGMGAVGAVLGIVALVSNTNQVTVNGRTIAASKSPAIALTPAGLVF